MDKIGFKIFLLVSSLLSFGETLNAMKCKSKATINNLFSEFHNTLNHEEFIDNEIKSGNVYASMKYNTLLHLDEFLCSLEVILSSNNAEKVKKTLKSLINPNLTAWDAHMAERSILKSDKIEMRRIGSNNIIIRFYRYKDDYLNFVKIYARRGIENGEIFWELIPFEVCNRIKK